MITTTVGDIIEALNKYALNTPVVIADPNGTGYHCITITRMMVYRIMANQDTLKACDFIDCFDTDIPEAFSAIVL